MILRRLQLRRLICTLRLQLDLCLGRCLLLLQMLLGGILLVVGLIVAVTVVLVTTGRTSTWTVLGAALLGLQFGFQSTGNVRSGVLTEVILTIETYWRRGGVWVVLSLNEVCDELNLEIWIFFQIKFLIVLMCVIYYLCHTPDRYVSSLPNEWRCAVSTVPYVWKPKKEVKSLVINNQQLI